jgi:hypothetical protein
MRRSCSVWNSGRLGTAGRWRPKCAPFEAVQEPANYGLFSALLDQFGQLGGVDLDLPDRGGKRS